MNVGRAFMPIENDPPRADRATKLGRAGVTKGAIARRLHVGRSSAVVICARIY
jgi:hypothetical protein